MNARAAAAIVLAAAAAGCASRAAPPPAPESGFATSADGVPIAWDARGAGEPAVVLVHGWRCDRGLWRWTAEDLARDHRVVCVDVGGHGASGADRGKWDVEALAGDVQAVVEALGLRRVVLVGHSMGGPICLAAAPRLKGRVAAVVGVDTLHDVEYHMPKEAVEPVIASLEADPEKGIRGFLPSMLAPGYDPALLDWLVARGMAADHRAACAIMRSLTVTDSAALLENAGVPVRCVNAMPGVTAFARPTEVAKNRKHGDFDAVLLEGVGHYPMVERPDAFNARLREVIAPLR